MISAEKLDAVNRLIRSILQEQGGYSVVHIKWTAVAAAGKSSGSGEITAELKIVSGINLFFKFLFSI